MDQRFTWRKFELFSCKYKKAVLDLGYCSEDEDDDDDDGDDDDDDDDDDDIIFLVILYRILLPFSFACYLNALL